MKRKIKSVFIIVLLALLAGAVPVRAADTMSAGNFFADMSDGAAADTPADVDRDAYALAQTVRILDSKIGADVIAAGWNVYARSSALGGSLRSASVHLVTSACTVKDNITSVAWDAVIGPGTTAAGVYVLAGSARFDGQADALDITAKEVVISGKVDGDVRVRAGNVRIKRTAEITGHLDVRAPSAPTMETGAQIGDVNVVITSEAAGKPLPLHLKIWKVLKPLVYWGCAMFITALFLLAAAEPAVAHSARALQSRPVPMLMTGFIALIAAPMLFILLFFLYLTIPLTTLLLAFYAIAVFSAPAFAGAALGRFAFKTLNGVRGSLLAAAFFGVCVKIPYLGPVIWFLCAVFTLGYWCTAMWAAIKTSAAPYLTRRPEQQKENTP